MLEVAREEDVGCAARSDVMRTKSGSMPGRSRKDLRKLICMKERYFQDKLAIVRTDWKLHVKVQKENEATF